MGYQLDSKSNPTGFIVVIGGENNNYGMTAWEQSNLPQVH